jgi:hypothetical protein
LIMTGFGDQLGFRGPGRARFLKYRFVRSKGHAVVPGSVLVEPDQNDLADALSQAVDDYVPGRGQCAVGDAAARSTVQQQTDSGTWAERIHRAAVDALIASTPSSLRIAWVSTWGVRCDIAETSRLLLDGFAGLDRTRVERPTVFCDDRTLASDAAGILIHPAWSLSNSESIRQLTQTVTAADPHVLVIQHHSDQIQWGDLVQLLRDRRIRNRIIVVTLHAVRRLFEMDKDQRADIVDVLARVSRVFVHNVKDLNLLKNIGLTANVTLFPHGAPARFPAPTARALTRIDRPMIGFFGPFGDCGGIPRLIEALSCSPFQAAGTEKSLLVFQAGQHGRHWAKQEARS